MSGLPANPSPSTVRRNPHLYNLPAFTADEKQALAALDKPKKRIRQSSKPLMNKLEMEWLCVLQERFPQFSQITAQGVRWKLGNGIWYKPDFVVFPINTKPVAYEVKGPFAHRGGFENLKIAAGIYISVWWILVWKESGQWKEQTILP